MPSTEQTEILWLKRLIELIDSGDIQVVREALENTIARLEWRKTPNLAIGDKHDNPLTVLSELE